MSVAHFAVGDRVQVRNLEVEEGLAGHMRAPVYCRGFTGEIARFCGIFGTFGIFGSQNVRKVSPRPFTIPRARQLRKSVC